MREIRAEILAIGDELLYGQIMDTNSLWISQQLTDIAVRVVHRATLSDEEKAILEAFEAAEKRADIVLITGGLGPTKDDLTKPVLAKYFQCKIELVPEALEAVKSYFEKRGRELTELNILQAHLPTKCTYVPNTMGTAPGMWFEENNTLWMSMPGVPHEMKKLMETFVFPQLKKRFSLPVIYHKVVKTVGIGESWLADKVSEWEEALPPHIKLAYLPSIGLVRLRLTAFGEDEKKLAIEVKEQIEKLQPLAGKYIYGFDNTSLEEAVGQLLRSQNKTVALAESCTGGYISHLITSVAGSSAYFSGSIVPYHNQFKEQILGVNSQTLVDHGAVSEETVVEMAMAVRDKFGADYGLASSGVAGPGGGSDEKPVGTVWIACASETGVRTKRLQLTDDRLINIQLSAISVLNLLRLEINQITE
ncbi:competence/damage-inducible protein A [Litoribacter populi]|uniref:competence/damage-inducible protein A n=1 Tax=Litoribacter populi TaxID=2598460 RepID=UPI00117C40E6|nr:competence/damage-inducible protein A [Litoribacter populi]